MTNDPLIADIHILSLPDYADQVDALMPRVTEALRVWTEKEGLPTNAILGGVLAYLGVWLVCSSVLQPEIRATIVSTIISAADSATAKERARNGAVTIPEPDGPPN